MRHRITIRFFLTLSLLSAAGSLPAGDATTEPCVLENQALRYSIGLRDGAVVSRSFVNRQSGKTVSLPSEEFLLEFKDGATVQSADCTAKIVSTKKDSAEILFSSNGERRPAVEVRVQYTALPGKAYLRKQISVRQKSGEPLRLMRADLENWKGCAQIWDSMHADRCPFGSHPIFCEDIWAGVEFVAAFNEYDFSGFVLRSRPGGTRLGAEWLPLHSTVVGAAPRDKVKEAFLTYIDDIRVAPPRMVWCYNTWWTLAPPIKEEDLVRVARDLKEHLFDEYGVYFDVFATDEGWADKHTIWEMNRKVLPHAFDELRKVVESAGGRLGMWISPSAIYPNSLDCAWAKQQGYSVVTWPYPWNDTATGVSLCDPRYSEKTKDSLGRLIRENRLGHIKFDGLIPKEDAPHDDMLPGLDSVEPLATQALSLLTAARKANPELVMEPTFLNSWNNYISPWLIQYADTIYSNAGGDYPRGIGPSPDYRESCTNAREWYIFSARKEVWLPQNASQFFDIVHCDAAGGFVNHVAMAVGRGRFFLPVYLTPKYVGDDQWAAFASLVRWSKANQSVLRNTVMLPSRVEQGEPYAYAHWAGKRGIVAIRNPSNESRTYGLDLRAAGAPADLADAVCYSQYPYRRGLASGVDGETIVPVRLAPWELMYMEITPQSELREPVAIGARWYRDDKGNMQIAADAGVKQVQVLQPGSPAVSHDVPATSANAPTGKLASRKVALLPEKQWLKVGDKPQTTASVDVECEVSVPDGASGKVLLLLEYPGEKHFPSRCTATVNGRETALEERSSGGQQGYQGGTNFSSYKSYWAGEIPYYSEWTWYICPVEAGKSRVHFTGGVAQPNARIGAWLWSERDRSSGLQSLAVPCSKPEMPQLRERIERQGVCIQSPTG